MSTNTARYALPACLALACATAPEPSVLPPDSAPDSAPDSPEPAWTSTFLDDGVLMAEVVRIEGPPGLRDHLVFVQDKEHHAHEMKTTPKGLLQRTVVRADAGSLEPIRCQLDRVMIVAERELIVLERPSQVPVSVVGEGDAFFRRTGEDAEQRGPTVRLVGRPK